MVEYLRASARRRLFDEESSLLAAAAGVGFGVGVYHRGCFAGELFVFGGRSRRGNSEG